MVSYVLYSVIVRLRHGRTPSGRATTALVVAALLPDLIDKPLSWQFGVLPSGRSMAHSALFALPVAAAVWRLSRDGGSPEIGPAFTVGYLSHVVTDAVYPVLLGEGLDLNFILWPLLPVDAVDIEDPLSRLFDLVIEFGAFVSSEDGWRFILLEAALFLCAVWLWTKDGMPGLRWLRPRHRAGSGGDRP